jgi:hypothetical protein
MVTFASGIEQMLFQAILFVFDSVDFKGIFKANDQSGKTKKMNVLLWPDVLNAQIINYQQVLL